MPEPYGTPTNGSHSLWPLVRYIPRLDSSRGYPAFRYTFDILLRAAYAGTGADATDFLAAVVESGVRFVHRAPRSELIPHGENDFTRDDSLCRSADWPSADYQCVSASRPTCYWNSRRKERKAINRPSMWS